ncbi:hypothetical protein ACEWY4_011856 [Coilia grayii]|uniref:Uncharacterized protein n=1 Tax=Coilia grayii TaxID=363190 RepID=A0ABD1JZF6_9TELE
MHKTETSRINLLLWDTGKRKIRYLYLGDRSFFSVTKTDAKEKQLIPLFLGADLYSDTDIRIENHTRYHAKFAKKGLATKLVFSSEHRFHGLRVPCGTNSLWFYSIQGIFRVAFELYGKQEQLSILESFQDLWKSRLNDDHLKMTYQLTGRFDSPQPHNTLRTAHLDSHRQTTEDTPNHCVSSNLVAGPHGTKHQDTPIYIPDPHVQSMLGAGPFKSTHQDTVDGTPNQCPHSPLVAGPFEMKHHDTPDDTPSEDHDYCSPVKTTAPDNTSQTCQVSQTLINLQTQLQLVQSLAPDQKHTLLSLLRLAENCADGKLLDEEHLAAAALSLLQLRTPCSLSMYSSPLLQAVAGWLGSCFHAANGCISQQVESFKVRHIEHISDLPPAEELAAELFPDAMRTLLVNWMGLSEEAALWKRHSEFPILLLILEFANHNLITGVAHVLYSSLICK